MWRIVALCWVFTAPALAGALVVAVLATPQLAAEAGLWIPIAALLGALYGVPGRALHRPFHRGARGAGSRGAALGLGPRRPPPPGRGCDRWSRAACASWFFDPRQIRRPAAPQSCI